MVGLGLAVMEAIKTQHPKAYRAMVRQIREADKKAQDRRAREKTEKR